MIPDVTTIDQMSERELLALVLADPVVLIDPAYDEAADAIRARADNFTAVPVLEYMSPERWQQIEHAIDYGYGAKCPKCSGTGGSTYQGALADWWDACPDCQGLGGPAIRDLRDLRAEALRLRDERDHAGRVCAALHARIDALEQERASLRSCLHIREAELAHALSGIESIRARLDAIRKGLP